MLRTTLTLSKDEVDNLVEFFELEFLPMVLLSTAAGIPADYFLLHEEKTYELI